MTKGSTEDSERSEAEAFEETFARQAVADAGLSDDLSSDDGVVFPLPKGASILRIVSSYDTRDTTRVRVPCAVCRQHQPHNRGFRVEIGGGAHVRMGIDCGEKHFGSGTWRAVLADYDRRVSNVRYLARVKPALDAIALVVPLVKAWRERAKLLGPWLDAFRADLGELFGELAAAARESEGRLEYERRRKRARVNKQGREETYTEPETVVIGTHTLPRHVPWRDTQTPPRRRADRTGARQGLAR